MSASVPTWAPWFPGWYPLGPRPIGLDGEVGYFSMQGICTTRLDQNPEHRRRICHPCAPPPGGSYLWTPSALATVILVENDLANRCKNCSALAGILQSLRCPFRARINLVNAPNGGSVKGGSCDESFRMKQACLRRVLTIGVVLRVCLATFVDHDDVVRPPTNNAGPPNRSGTNLICEATN
jgi:hypothetical protein